jgi:hypothetical protein
MPCLDQIRDYRGLVAEADQDCKAHSEKQQPKTEPTARVSKRRWAKIVKKPESYKGDKHIICQVTQFDSVTGDDSLPR